MATKLFVGSLAFSATDDDLAAFFAPAGNVVSAKVVTDRETNRSRGFGFVEMGTEEEAQAAIKELNGKELNGRPVAVSEARPQEKREPRSFNNGGYNNRNDHGSSY